jgi:hypothetical protein
LELRNVTAFIFGACFLETAIALSYRRTRNLLYGMKKCGAPREENRTRKSESSPEEKIEKAERRSDKRTDILRNDRLIVCLTTCVCVK